MAKGLGMAIGTGVDRLARGLALGQNLRAAEEQRGLAAEDRAFTRKQRAREEANWQQQDADRANQQRARQLAAAYKLIQSGAYEPDTPQGQKTLRYVQNMMRVFDGIGGQQDPQALEAARQAFNDRHAEVINKGTGMPLDKDVSIGGGQTLPKGSVINRKEISRVFPRQDGSVLFAVKSYATTPDGKPVEYESFVTQNRSTDDDDPVLAMPVDDLYRSVESDMTLMDLVGSQGRDKTLAMLEAELTALGADIPTAPKLEEFKREEGDQIVTYQRDARGNVKEVARAPRWNPKPAAQRERQPTTIEEYRALVNEVGQEEADRIWSRAKPSAARNELPLSPNQVLSQARAARATAESRLKNEAANNFDLQNDPAAQAKRREELFDEELNYLAIDRDMVREAVKRTGKADPMGGDGKQSGADTAPVQVTTEAEIAALPKGAKFTFNGRTYTRN